MQNKHIRYLAAVTAAAAVFSGCSYDISTTLPPEVTAVEVLATQTTTTSAATSATTAAPVTTTTTTAPETTEPVTETQIPDDTTAPADVTATEPEEGTYTIYSDEYKTYPLSDEYNEFLSECVFVGDSICSGLKAYDILPGDQVVAVGNVAARNIFEDWVEFKVNGSKLSLIPALVDLNPKYIVFSMGMNDVNITSEQTFCDNYRDILSQVHTFLPDATLIVCSITPITYGESGTLFTACDNIDSFNAALKEYLDSTDDWIYADVSHELKNTHNMLKADYLGSPDGVHLAPYAYYAILYQLCERMVDGKVYNPEDGTFTVIGEDDAEETTAGQTAGETPEVSADDGDLLSGTIHLDVDE